MLSQDLLVAVDYSSTDCHLHRKIIESRTGRHLDHSSAQRWGQLLSLFVDNLLSCIVLNIKTITSVMALQHCHQVEE